jgi:hypothetical protein
MLNKTRHLIDLNNRLVLNINKRYLAAKPFYYQELFEHAKPLNTPFKKLTSIKFLVFKI